MAVEENALEVLAGKSLPHSREAEEAVISSCLQDVDAIAEVVELLRAEDFYVKSNEVIFHVLLDLFNQGSGTDITIVGEELLRRGELQRIGGAIELARILDVLPSAANAQYHARIVLDKSLQRRLIGAAGKILEEARSGRGNVQQLVDTAEATIFEVAHRTVGSESASLGDTLQETLRAIEMRRDGEMEGVPTHYPDLDEKLGGMLGGQMLILAARPSMGKTTMALNIALRAATARERAVPVALFSLEMPRDQLALNLLCSFSHLDSHKLRKGLLTAEDWERVGNACQELSSAPIFIDDAPGLSTMQIRAKARRLKSMHDIGLIVIDYLQLVQGPKSESRQQEISQISMAVKRLARELDVPIIAISQLNRSVDAREDHRPRMSDLRESGSLEQDADVVMFLYREDYYDQGRNPSSENKAQLIIAKQRNGPIGDIALSFFPDQLRFEPYSALDYRE